MKAVTVTQPATPGSGDLDKSIRVAVVCGTNSVIYAPVTGATTSYKVATAVTDGTATFPDAANVNALAATTESSAIAASVPAKGASTYGGVDIRIYVYYEGEDANHFSNNIQAITATTQKTAAPQPVAHCRQRQHRHYQYPRRTSSICMNQ